MALLVGGSFGLALAFWGLLEDVGFIAQPFYAYAWWSYILLLDGLVALRRGSSILTRRRGLFLPLVVWSTTFWFFFELLNLRFQNWYYVGVFASESTADLVAGALFGVLSFATVFLGLFETYEALGALGIRPRPARPRPMPTWVSFAVQGLGVVMVALSLLFSHYLSPLIWGSVTFLLDPWNYRRGARSILADVESGHVAALGRLLLAGLLCGLVWESFNYLAPQKWIYTVRGLDELKLFEMPLLGFLGFPALALDAFSFFAFVSYWFHGNRTWENPEDVPQALPPRPAIPGSRFAASLPLHALFWGAISLAMEGVNVGSIELTLEDLRSLPSGAVAGLEESGIHRPRQLLRALDDPSARRRLETSFDLSSAQLDDLREEARLLTLKGIGPHHGELLRRAGIGSVGELARMDPDALYERLARLRGDDEFPALRREMVRVWVHAARRELPEDS